MAEGPVWMATDAEVEPEEVRAADCTPPVSTQRAVPAGDMPVAEWSASLAR